MMKQEKRKEKKITITTPDFATSDKKNQTPPQLASLRNKNMSVEKRQLDMVIYQK